MLSTALGRGARLRQRARRAGAGAGEPTPGAAPGGWVGAGMSQPNRVGLGLALQAEDKAWREDELKLPASGVAHSLSLGVLPASPHTELLNLEEVSEIRRDPEVGEKLGLQRCLRLSCPLPGRKGRRDAAPGPSTGERGSAGALMVVPRAMETLGFSKQGNRSCSCRAYAPTVCREGGGKNRSFSRRGAVTFCDLCSPSGTNGSVSLMDPVLHDRVCTPAERLHWCSQPHQQNGFRRETEGSWGLLGSSGFLSTKLFVTGSPWHIRPGPDAPHVQPGENDSVVR